MNRRSAKWSIVLLVSLATVFFLSPTSLSFAAPNPPPGGKIVRPTTIQVVASGISKPMRDMKVEKPTPHDPHNLREVEPAGEFKRVNPFANARTARDPLVQKTMHGRTIPGPILDFDGVGDVNGVQPADTTMDVSDDATDQILQWVNLSYAVYQKSTGNLLAGPFAGNNFWSGISGQCNTFNGGDILVRWDQFASQWWVAQLAYQSAPYHICVAVSTTSDALGSYYQYDFQWKADNSFPDYPHWNLWPVLGAGGATQINNGMYITIRNFGATFSMNILALDRTSLLVGTAAAGQIFDIGPFDAALDGLEGSDLRGVNSPPQGALPTFIGPGHPNTDGSPGPVIHLFQTYTDFTDPSGASSFITQLTDIDVADFDPGLPNGAPQVGGGTLETLQQFGQNGIQYRADYRVFINTDGSLNHDSLLLLHDVNVNSACGAGEQGGERWHEVQHVVDGLGSPTLFQEGTFGPCDQTYRWMGSLAQDASGDMALGFSATSGGGGIVNDPSVHYTGRLVSDPLGDMSQGEGTYLDSSLAFGGFRWGDYSTMVADPTDQCTFFYTTMYGNGDWSTRIGSFKFPSCTAGPSGTLEGHVTDASNGNPISGALVQATPSGGGTSSTFTDAAGHYTFTLPVGTYDMNVSKYGYLPGSASGVSVTNGGDTTQDFALTVAPMTTVSGTVTDGSGEGWPLDASIKISGNGYPGATIYSNPYTGAYSISLSQGLTYTFTVNAISPGYNTATAMLTLRPRPNGGVTQNFQLTVNQLTCNAPGYTQNLTGLYESFDSGGLPAGWTVVQNSGPDTWFVTSGPEPCFGGGNTTGGSGPFALIDYCTGFNVSDSELRTPSVDLSALSAAQVRFNLDLYGYPYPYGQSIADVDISTNGGGSWTNVFDRNFGASERGPAIENIDITGIAAGQPNVMARFHWQGLAWFWQVDNVLLGNASCNPQTGGLVVGHVFDANTGLGVNGATITNLTSPPGSTTSFTDPDMSDGFYILFAPPGAQTLDASAPNYSDDIQTPTVIVGSVINQDFHLATGLLSASPNPLSEWLDYNTTGTLQLNISNTGGGSADFSIIEINARLTKPVRGKKAKPVEVKVPKELLNERSTKSLSSGNAPPPAAPIAPKPGAPGDVIATYPTQIAFAWGVGFNLTASDFWLSNLAVAGGDNHDYRYLTDGTKTGDTIDDSSWVGVFVGDGTFNTRTGKLWWVNVGGDNCLYEDDPVTKTPTGNKICGSPWTNTSQRGVAYNVTTDTYYVGGWNEGIIYHIDGTGAVLDSAQVTLGTCNQGGPSTACISGLEYNASNGHLFVMTNWQDTDMMYVLDANNNYALLSSFTISGFSQFGGAGLEADCAGHLWLTDQSTQTIYEVDSGESGGGCDIPWLSENPTSGTVAPGTTFPVDCIFDGTINGGLTPGLRQAQLAFSTSTPTGLAPVGVNFTVLFADVPHPQGFAENFIYGAAGANITAGCGVDGNGKPIFCPNNPITRAEMAVFVIKGEHGPSYVPPDCVPGGIFEDVICSSPGQGDFAVNFIEQFYREGITAGCVPGNGPDPAHQRPKFCPTDLVTRAQMAVFIDVAVRGAGNPPPACTGIFADVPCPGGFAVDFIEDIYNKGITGGCGINPLIYCPNDNNTRAQMAVFVVVAFNVPHL